MFVPAGSFYSVSLSESVQPKCALCAQEWAPAALVWKPVKLSVLTRTSPDWPKRFKELWISPFSLRGSVGTRLKVTNQHLSIGHLDWKSKISRPEIHRDAHMLIYCQDLPDSLCWQGSVSDAWGGGFVRQNIFHKFFAPLLWKCWSRVSETAPNTPPIPLWQKRRNRAQRQPGLSFCTKTTSTSLCNGFDKTLAELCCRGSQPM